MNFLLNSICGFAAAWFVLEILNHLLSIRNHRWAKPLLYIGCWLFVGMIIFVGDLVNLPGALLTFAAVVFLCCEGSRLQRFSFMLILASLGFSFNALVDSYLPLKAIYVLRFFMWLGVYLSIKRLAPKQKYALSTPLWILVDVLTLTPFAAMLITILLSNGYYQGIELRDVILLPVIFLSSLGLLWVVVILARQQKLEKEKLLYQMNQTYYQQLEQEQFEVRRLRHDMANHFQTMSSLSEAEMRKYLENLIQSPAMDHSRRFCQNNVVNAVLAAKQRRIEAAGIISDITVSLPDTLPVDEVDLCALFANSLDNAIEACEQLPQNQRHITVKARADKGLFMLQVQNSIKGSRHQTNGLFKSTKPNAKMHGFGLTSIREIVDRYNGTAEFTSKEQQFILLLYFPLWK